ncbi:MAG: hypothetical protein DMD81_10050 [Candidatus Rokuibacteriota bacterium]|nr:MAG: hypothetical protein DMD81_10050 [Candidatus Rokubacteria bacterium]
MRSSSLPSIVERARPLLGTYVAIRVSGVPESCAHGAIDAAFDQIALVHHRMSFHEAESDVSRLNENALRHAVQVHPRTYEVLRWAQQIAEASHGWFDVTVARHLVAWGVLPRPRSAYDPDPRASWRDIELRRDGAVRFHRPTWIDLGGIAKGYAVDRAVELLRASGVPQGCVNAGGDLRVFGPAAERVRLRTGSRVRGVVPVVDVENASIASSGRARRPRSIATGPEPAFLVRRGGSLYRRRRADQDRAVTRPEQRAGLAPLPGDRVRRDRAPGLANPRCVTSCRRFVFHRRSA